MKSLCCIAVLAGCSTSDDVPGGAEQASSTLATCANPAAPAYGGTLNDGTDDTVAIHKAVCAAMCPTVIAGCGPCTDPTLPGYASHAVCLPAGELDVTRPVPPFNPGRASIDLAGVQGLTLSGQGPASVLAMHGSGAGSCSNPCKGDAGPCFADWKLIAIRAGSRHVEIRDLTLTATGVDGFDSDSTRLVEFGDQASNTDDLLIKNTRMIDACGDHLYVIGGAIKVTDGGVTGEQTTTLGVRVLDSTFVRASRRSITLKHGVNRVVIAGNTFETDGGAVDLDPSGLDTPTTSVVIANNTFRSASAASIVLAGESGRTHPPASDVVVANNLMFGPGIIGGGLRNVTIRNNTILNSLSEPELELNGISERLEISNNTIVRGSTATRTAVRVQAKEVATPELRIAGNTIVQASRGPAIEVQDIQHQVIANNVISMTWADAGAPAAAGIRTQTDHFNVASCQLSGNSVTGLGAALSAGIVVNLTSSLCGRAIPPTACTSDAQCAMGGLCHVGPEGTGTCGCQPTLANAQVDRNFVTGAAAGIVLGVGTFGTPATAKGFLGTFPMIANNDVDASVASPIRIAGKDLPVAYVIGGNQGGPVQLVGDTSPITSGVAAPNGSTFMVRGGTTAGTAALYFRVNNTWVAQ